MNSNNGNEDLKISEIMNMQIELWEKNKDKWSPMEPEYGKDFLLYMVEEMGEAISVIKKKGSKSIMNDQIVRDHFIEEMCDVLCYYYDTLLRYKVTPEELSLSYIKKHEETMNRDYKKKYDEFLKNSKG